MRRPHRSGEGGQNMLHICGQTVNILRTERGEGGKKSQNYVDVIYGIPHTVFDAPFPALRFTSFSKTRALHANRVGRISQI